MQQIRLGFVVLTAFSVLTSGCASTFSEGFEKAGSMLKIPSLVEEKEALADSTPIAKQQFVGDYTTVSGVTAPQILGVGLVTGLDGTGGDVPPSSYRRSILEDMRKRNVHNPEKLLQSPSTAVVVVRAFLPPLAKKGDKIDVEVQLPAGSEATSLRGGWLLPCGLAETAYVAGRGELKDDVVANASGPILLSPSLDDDLSNAGVVRRGTIPGGAKYKSDKRTLSLNLSSDFRSVRMAKRIADNVGRRFHGFDEYGVSQPLAEAKTDTRIELDIPDVYRDNFPRYLKVVRRVATKESPIETRIRMERLREELLIPEKSEDAALQLEAIGKDAILVLREALSAESLLCRFQAAAALAYLGDDTGVEVLGEAAHDRALRVWAFLAMSALDGGEAVPELIDLLDENSIETRYAAVRALTTIDENHPAVAGTEITDRCYLRVLDTKGDPMIHLTKSQKSEMTLFGYDQEFQLPMTARAGTKILIVGRPGERTVRLTRFEPGLPEQKRTVSPRVADVLSAAADLGASYPDLVGLLLEAEEQHNLQGLIAIDALPQGGRVYTAGAFSTGTIPKEERPSIPEQAFETEELSNDSKNSMTDEASPPTPTPIPTDVLATAGHTVMQSQPVAPQKTSPQAMVPTPAESAVDANELPPAQAEPTWLR